MNMPFPNAVDFTRKQIKQKKATQSNGNAHRKDRGENLARGLNPSSIPSIV